ncbi:MAG: glycosyltransferase [Candidatus Calescibacterium sp.]|nr:glycosyltransferase [Candidatus Calescibacterium sp.]MDW8195432.1 glycosyltransferase [Candidatus Calescibacterium sp.]
MNIAILTNVFFPVTNGVVHSIHLLSRGLKELEKNVSVISSEHPKFNQQIISQYNINYNVVKLKSIYFPGIDYCIPNPFISEHEEKLKDIKADIIQINHPFMIYRLSKILKKYNPKSKVLFVYHTQYHMYHHYFRVIPKFIYNKFLDFHLKEIFEFVDAVVFPSLSIKKAVENKFEKYKDKFIYISNPVDLDHIKHYNEDKVNHLKMRNNLEGKFIIGFVGRLEKEKNIDKLLELFKHILDFFREKSIENIRLVIVGGGTEYNNLVKYANSLRLNDYVIFLGKVDYKEIPNYYRIMDVFVTLSLTEVKPLAYLESLASGVPIVSFRAAGTDDLIIDKYNGFLIDYNPGYTDKFVEVIYNLYSNRELLKQIKYNSYLSSQNYCYLKIAGKYLETYQDLCKRN